MKLFEQRHPEIDHGDLPSVSKICELAWLVRPDYPAKATASGISRHSEVATAISNSMRGLVPPAEGAGAAALRLLAEFNARPVYVEKYMYSPELGYRGRLDLIAEIDRKLIVIDWKGSSHNEVYNLQIAGYALMATAVLNRPVTHGILINWDKRRHTWQPRIQADNPEHLILEQHTACFKACLTLWHWRKNNLPQP